MYGKHTVGSNSPTDHAVCNIKRNMNYIWYCERYADTVTQRAKRGEKEYFLIVPQNTEDQLLLCLTCKTASYLSVSRIGWDKLYLIKLNITQMHIRYDLTLGITSTAEARVLHKLTHAVESRKKTDFFRQL